MLHGYHNTICRGEHKGALRRVVFDYQVICVGSDEEDYDNYEIDHYQEYSSKEDRLFVGT